MKNATRALSLLVLAALLCAMMTTAVLADESEIVWLSVTETDGKVTAHIVTNTVVTDGYIKLTYDANTLTYDGVTTEEAYVSQYSVNPGSAGTVKIAWVAPGEYTADGTGLTLIQVRFTGTDASSLELTGIVHDAAGKEISLGQVDTSALSAAIADAEALKEADYTAESWKVLADALADAKAALADPTVTQSEADAAAAALTGAIAALQKAPASQPTQPDDGGNSDTGDDTPLTAIIIVMAVCLIGMIVLVIIIIRKGRKE